MDNSGKADRKRTEPVNTLGIEKSHYSFRSGHFFMIDLAQEMLDNEPESYFHTILLNFMDILKQKLARNRKDWMGLMICNVVGNETSDGVLVIQKFEEVSVDMYARVLRAYERDIDYYKNLISPTRCSIANILQEGTRQFGTDTPKMATRQFILLTTIDNPAPNDLDEQHQIRLWASNYKGLNIRLQIVGFGDDWNYEAFYKEIEMLSEKSSSRKFQRITLDELENGISHRAHVLANFDLRISDKAKVRVTVQNFISSRVPMTQSHIDRVTNEPLDRVNYWIYHGNIQNGDEPIDEFLVNELPNDNKILSYIKCGGKNLTLPAHIVNSKRQSRERGIDIIGFKPQLETDCNKIRLGPVLFVGCHCSVTDPQAQFFTALLSKMNSKKVMAICAVTLRNCVSTGVWMMYPCIEYGGFYLECIPFKESIREKIYDVAVQHIYQEGEASGSEEEVKLMKKIVKMLRLKGHPLSVCNPRLERERKIVESLALDLPREDYVDNSLPYPEMTARLNSKGLIHKFRDTFPEVHERESKRPKLDPDEVKKTVRERLYTNYTVEKLKAVLRTLNESTSGKKSELLARLDEYRRHTLG